MVRRATTLDSLDELDLSARTKTFLIRKYNRLDRIVWYGRWAAVLYRRNKEAVHRANKSTLELINALKKAGFIRNDIGEKAFRVNFLYHMVYLDRLEPIIDFPCCIEDMAKAFSIADNGELLCLFDYRLGNENYENFQGPTEEQIELIKATLKRVLTEEEYMVLACHFGFEGDKVDVIERLGIPEKSFYQILQVALNKLRENDTLLFLKRANPLVD